MTTLNVILCAKIGAICGLAAGATIGHMLPKENYDAIQLLLSPYGIKYTLTCMIGAVGGAGFGGLVGIVNEFAQNYNKSKHL